MSLVTSLRQMVLIRPATREEPFLRMFPPRACLPPAGAPAKGRRGWSDTGAEEGHAATEYAILLAVLILGSMGVIGIIGEKFRVLYTMLAEAVGGTM